MNKLILMIFNLLLWASTITMLCLSLLGIDHLLNNFDLPNMLLILVISCPLTIYVFYLLYLKYLDIEE